MHKMAQALLTHRYEDSSSNAGPALYSPNGPSKNVKQMRTIEVRTKKGQPLLVLQSEDTPLAIEKTLKENGWSIVSWNGDNIQLAAIAVLQNQTAMQKQAAVKAGTAPNGKAGAVGCLVILIVMVFFVSCSVIVSSSTPKKPKVVDSISAQVMCEEFVKRELNAPSTAKFTQQEESQGPKANNWIATGFVESENRLGGTAGHNYICNLTYFPETDKWSSDTKIV